MKHSTPPFQRTMVCFVPGLPIPQGSMKAFNNPKNPKIPLIVHTSGTQLKRWRKWVADCVAEKWVGGPTQRFVSLTANFHMPLVTFTKTGAQRVARTEYPTIDLDKLLRAILDSLKGVVYVDDNRVASVSGTKAFADPSMGPGVHLCAYEIGVN